MTKTIEFGQCQCVRKNVNFQLAKLNTNKCPQSGRLWQDEVHDKFKALKYLALFFPYSFRVMCPQTFIPGQKLGQFNRKTYRC